jgi:hypothetical protein
VEIRGGGGFANFESFYWKVALIWLNPCLSVDIETPPWASKRCVSNNSYFERDVSKPKIDQ